MRINLHLLSTLSLILLAVNLAYPQAWTRPRGGGFAQLGWSYITNHRVWNNGGKELDLRRQVMDMTLQAYTEYGVAEKWTAVVFVPYKTISTGSAIYDPSYLPDTLPSGNLNGIGNLSFVGVYGFKQSGPWVGSFKLRFDLPTAGFDSTIGIRTGTDAFGIAPIFNFGKGRNSYFITYEIGANFRSNGYSSQFISNLQYGRKFAGKLWVIGMLEYVASLKDGNFNDGSSVHTAVYTNNLDYLAFI